MKRHICNLRWICVWAVGLCICAGAHAEEPNAHPNILFIFADDHSYEALGAVGGEVQTPHLDRLMSRGVTFTDAYNQGGWHGAVCVASRTMLMTGRFLWNAKSIEKSLKEETEARRLWPQLMHDAGYETWFSGKWHVKADAHKVFDHAVHVRPGMPNQTDAGYDRPRDAAEYEKGWKPWDTSAEGFWKGGKHWSEVLADDAEQFLEKAGKSDDPFFMYLAFNAPHDPRQSPREYVEKYPVESVKVPENFLTEYPYKDGIGCSKSLRDEKLAPFPRTEYSVQVNRQEYFALITHMDDQIGRILDALEATGKADSTYIFFSADHGLSVGHHGLIGKQNMYEHSVRVPLIIAGPDIPAGKSIESPIYLQDLMPTALDLAGIERLEHVQFQSLLPLIRNKRSTQYAAIYGAYIDLQRMVRKGNFKLIYYPKLDRYRLFDLSADPNEQNDLIENPEHQERVAELKAELKRLEGVTGGA